MDKVEYNEEKILDALKRSGYLFESEISKQLVLNNFFVESNKTVIDPHTGKSREIDLIAEYDDFYNKDHSLRCSSRIEFVFEIKNNSAPLVLLTEYQYSANEEIWNAIKEYITISKDLDYHNSSVSELLVYNNKSLYTQYCSFQEKKGSNELMALHPDNIYSSIQKIAQYCEERIGYYENQEDDYLRHWIYMPVLLISDDLYELKIVDGNKPLIKKTEESTLVYNYHYKNEPTSCLIKVITREGLESFINKMLSLQETIENEMINLKKVQN